MPLSKPLPRVSVYLEGLRVSLAVGAAWDLTLAAALLTAPGAAAAALGVPVPGPAWFLPFVAVLLAANALVSLLPITDPISYRGNALGMGIVRLGRATALCAALLGPGQVTGLVPLVAVDGVLGLLHTVGWWRSLR